jgi:polysaccharide export outer membrane protein
MLRTRPPHGRNFVEAAVTCLRRLGRVFGVWLLAPPWLAGCAMFPAQGPGALDPSPTAQVTTQERVGYVLVEIDNRTIGALERLGPKTAEIGRLPNDKPTALRLGVGDVVNITIFEATAGGLFIPAESTARAGNYVNLPPQEIDARGTVQVPFAGQVRAAGRTAAELKAEIERTLQSRAINPQAVVTLQESRSTVVSVTGDVNQPIRFALSRAHDRILDALTRAGGSKWAPHETYVTLVRGGRSASVYYNRLLSDPSANVFLRPGDSMSVSRVMRSFQALGASGQNGFVNFEAEKLTLSEALGRSGGVLDSRGDPTQTYIYRLEDRRLVQSMGYDVSAVAGERVPVVYHVNLRDPQGYFLAAKFQMADKDILYVSNAVSVELAKVLQIFATAAASAYDVKAAGR